MGILGQGAGYGDALAGLGQLGVRGIKRLYIDAGPSEQSGMPKNRWMFARTLALAGLLLCGLVCEASAAGGVRFSIDKWVSAEDGLPQSSVIALTQTRDGYLWLGTLNGLARFDGARFTVFNEGNTPGLNSSQIVRLFEDSHGNLWIGTQTAGASLVKDGRVIGLNIGRGSSEGRLMAATEDRNGSVWLYTADGQLCRYQDGKVDIWATATNSSCRALITEKSGLMWVGSDRGLFAIRPGASSNSTALALEQELSVGKLDLLLASERGGHWRLVDGRVQKWDANRLERDWGAYPWTNGVTVYAACEDLQGNLVVGTLGQGIFWFDAQGKATCLSTNDGLSENTILSLQSDREGSLWVGTDGGGLNRVKRQVFESVEQCQGWTVRSVVEDRDAGLWFSAVGVGTPAGAYHLKDGVLKHYDVLEGGHNFFVRTMFVDRDQRVWAGTFGGGLYQLQEGEFRPAPGFPEAVNREIFAIHQDRSGQLWVGTQGGLARWDGQSWKVFATGDKPSGNIVRALADDAEGNLWIGTYEGLDVLRDGKITSVVQQKGLPGEHISSLYADKAGVLWIGTDGKGLARFYKGKWTSYMMKDGLISDSIGYLQEDDQGDQGYLWMGSNAGLMRAPKKALNDFAAGLTNFIPCRAYGRRDGLPTSECSSGSQPAACRTRDGRLWFPTIKGLASVDPAQLILNTNPPAVMIEGVLIEGREVTPSRLRTRLPPIVTVPPDKELLEIQYTGLNLPAPDRVRFKYRLEGHETAWTEARSVTSVHYTKLSPNNYRFHVIACNEDGFWNETGATLAIVVEPPFWRTWWFLSAMSLLLLAAIIGVVHYVSTQRLQRQLEGMRQQQALEKERSRIARDIHDQVGASLTQVSMLGEMVESDKDLPEEVEAHARQISQTARETSHALDEIVWTVNPSNDTLDGLVNYICKYAQEYLAVADVRYRLDVPAELPATPISPEVRHNVFLAAKESVTNVVKHAKASSAWIRLRIEPGTFTLEIQDDGRGPGGVGSKAAQSRNGLRNMHKRMEDIGGSFSITPVPEGGTLVRLTVPIKNR
ncbi:MAG: Histidine kinase [Pedosphaera sp.]|nr:Histidine kinase [Pedosphaera sp.]